jgi:hypothetical protein
MKLVEIPEIVELDDLYNSSKLVEIVEIAKHVTITTLTCNDRSILHIGLQGQNRFGIRAFEAQRTKKNGGHALQKREVAS